MSTKARSKRTPKARSTMRTPKAKSTKKSTKRSTRARDWGAKKGARSSGILKGGTDLGIEKGDSTVGRIKIGGEAGLESDYSSGEFKEGAEDVFDSIKSGIVTAKKKISDVDD